MKPNPAPPTLASVASFQALYRAAQGARRGKSLTLASATFFVDIETEIFNLERELLAGAWRPGGYRSFIVSDPKPRVISASTFRDRVVHHALCEAIGPLLDGVAMDASCACRVGRGTHVALTRVREAVARAPGGWFLKLDIRRYFETIDHPLLLDEVGEIVRDEGLRALIGRIVDAGAPGSANGKGLPIGNLTSQHLANFHLSAFDRWVDKTWPDAVYTRYMDDLFFVIPGRAAARSLEAAATRFLAERRLLEVKAEATRKGPVFNGVPFLGCRIWPAHVRFDRHRKRRLGVRIREVRHELEQNGDDARASMRMASLLGWAALGHAEKLFASILEDNRGKCKDDASGSLRHARQGKPGYG